ncbi:MAG: Bug family tripartite tricarboxylate transporter substrate binding protein [Burkholderiales bacterium]
MNRTTSRRRFLQVASAGAATLSLPAFAAWPERPIRIIVTFPPGGASDIVARLIGDQLATKLGQAVVIDNRPGAGGSIGGQLVAQAAPDGYTLMLSNSTPISIGPFALEKQPYDPVEAFTHIAMIGSAPCVVMANPKSGLKSMNDLIAEAKKSGRLDFGSGGPASIGHVYGELMKTELGINMVHVPYRGGAPMTTDLVAGIVPVGIDVITAFVQYFRSGQIVPLAVTSAARSPLAPDVPSVLESGHKNLLLDNFFGVSGPARMQPDVVARINTAVNEIVAGAEIRRKMTELGITTMPGTQASFAKFVKDQVAQLAPAVRGAGVKL